MTENISPSLLLAIEFTTEGTHISLNREWTNFALSSASSQVQTLSSLTLLNFFIDSKRFEKEMKKFAKSFDIEKLERNLSLLENRGSIH